MFFPDKGKYVIDIVKKTKYYFLRYIYVSCCISFSNTLINIYTEYKTNSAITKQIKAIEAFIERHQVLSSLFTMANLEAGMSFDIDICDLYEDSEFMKQWPNFKHEIHENPTNTLNCMKLSIHQVYLFLFMIK